MQRATSDAARRRKQAEWQATMLRALQLRSRVTHSARKLEEGWTWVDAAEGQEREKREDIWLRKLARYERDVDELREAERTLRDEQATT